MRVASFTDFAFVDEPLVAYTDDPEGSVRKRETDVETQRERVFRSYLAWAPSVSRHVLALRMKMARTAARACRRRLAARFHPA